MPGKLACAASPTPSASAAVRSRAGSFPVRELLGEGADCECSGHPHACAAAAKTGLQLGAALEVDH